ncbi:hypothetical protein ZWY2020_012100 [Hordeum vulgare]|nr:hypothetical protein ZWY2020_012100 [Hordeum vulgare]
MTNKKLAPNRDKHSAAKEAVESALQLARSPLPGTRRRAPPFASDADESTAPSPKNTASSPAKNTAPSSAKDQALASSSEGESDDAPAPAKNTASASAKNEAQAEAPTESSAYQEQREKGFLEEAENTQQQAADQLPENGRDFDEAEADRIIPAGPSISKIVEDHQNFDPYLSSDIHKDYVKIMSSCPPGMEVCVFCYFEKDSKTQRSQSRRIVHTRNLHDSLANSFSNKTRKRVVSGLPVALWKWNTINLIRALHFFRMSKARRKPSKDAKAEFPDL